MGNFEVYQKKRLDVSNFISEDMVFFILVVILDNLN